MRLIKTDPNDIPPFYRAGSGSSYKQVGGRALPLLTLTGTSLVLATGVASAANITCPPLTGVVECVGTNNDDRITGTADGDTIRGRRGNDLVDGRAGNDEIRGGPDNDTLRGGDGDDRYLFYASGGPADWGRDTINDPSGTANSLSFSGVTTPVRLEFVASPVAPEAQSGNNTLDFPATFTVIEADGGTADDVILGNDLENFINGFDGNDFLDGRGGEDTLIGAAGRDTIYVVDGEADTVLGEESNDTIYAVDDAADDINCGDGNDTVYADVGAVADLLTDCENVNP
jgi:Ca2+-binding RTX toxin-like protein